MAKRGQKIDELYISLGLDIARLQLDFDTAGKTVSQAMARLQGQSSQIKLKMDVDLAKLEGVGTALDKLKVKHQAINQQLDIQRKKEEILAAVLRDAQKNSGVGSDAAHRAETNLLKQQKIVAQTEAEVRKLNAEMKALGGTITQTTAKAGGFGSAISMGLSKAREGISGLSGGFSTLSANAAAAMAVLSTGAGLFSLTKGAVESGENLYRLTKRLHASAAEAGQLSRTFQLAGMDVMTIVPLIARLDKQVEMVGEKGNSATRAMERFGISLLDSSGNLLPLNEQLEQLAKGYQYAMETGQEEAYTAEVLGARGAALIPLLEQYDELMQVAAGVKTTGLLNPEECHQTWLQWKSMQMELSQLQSALGSALLPLASELMPSVTDAFREMVQVVQTNKDTIRDAIEGWGAALKTVAEILVFIGEQLHAVSEHAKGTEWLWENHPLAGPIATIPFLSTPVLDGIYGDEYKAHLEEEKALREKAEAEKAAAMEAEKNRQAQDRAAAGAGKRTAAEKEAAKAAEDAAKANDQLTESLYELTHSDLENALHSLGKELQAMKEAGADPQLLDEYKLQKEAAIYGEFQRNVLDSVDSLHQSELEQQLLRIDREAEAYRKKGLDEERTARWVAESKARVMESFEEEVTSKIDALWQTELETRLADIEREKKAWIRKGLDEVRATQAAEEQKRRAVSDSVVDMLSNNRKYLMLYRKIMAGQTRGFNGGMAVYDLNASQEDRLARVREEFRKQMLMDAHIDPNERISLDELHSVQQLMNEAKNTMGLSLLQGGGMDGGIEKVTGVVGTAMESLAPQISQSFADAMNTAFAPLANGEVTLDSPRLNDALQAVQGTLEELRTVMAALAQQKPEPPDITVSIGTAVTPDNESMTWLADTVADKIAPVVEQAIGGDSNSY